MRFGSIAVAAIVAVGMALPTAALAESSDGGGPSSPTGAVPTDYLSSGNVDLSDELLITDLGEAAVPTGTHTCVYHAALTSPNAAPSSASFDQVYVLPAGSSAADWMDRPNECNDGTVTAASLSRMASNFWTVEGSSAVLPLGKHRGALNVRVTVERAAASTTPSVTVTASRELCALRDVGGNDKVSECASDWRQTSRVPTGDYSLDAVLATATLRWNYRGHVMALTWHGVGDLTTQTGDPNGPYLLLQTRDAIADGTWAGHRWAAQQYVPNRDAGTTMYRRVVPPID